MYFTPINRREGARVLVGFVVVTLCWYATGRAQTLTTGAITGVVKDPSGAVIPNAEVTATNIDNGGKRITTSGQEGIYLIPLVNPGEYSVAVAAKGFITEERRPITVAVNHSVEVNFSPRVGAATEVVEVAGAAPLIERSNPNNTTTLTATELAEIPNPGNDLAFAADFAPGATMYFAGSGNVEFNGLPAMANNFTVDGLDANDVFFNLNMTGATNLQLGLDAIAEVSVNTHSYSVDQGRLSAAQINYVSKSGTQTFHGKAQETWNGSALNATDFFLNAQPFTSQSDRPHKPRSNVHEFAASAGGPIKRDKLFFFTDLEGNRIVLPFAAVATVPSNNYRNYVLAQLLVGGCDYVFDPRRCAAGNSSFNYPAQPAEEDFYQNVFRLYGEPKGVAAPIFGCRLDADGNLLAVPSPATPNAAVPNGSGCGDRRTVPFSNHTGETVWSIRLDHNLNERNTFWYKFWMDNGVQPTGSNPINPIFSIRSIQPERQGTAGWTHTFSPTLVNQFNPGFNFYRSDMKPSAEALKLLPLFLFGPLFTPLGAGDSQGRDVTQWQLNDNLSWTRGTHIFRFGDNLRRVLISNHDFSSVPFIQQSTEPLFRFGATDFMYQSFPRSVDEPFGLVNLDLYAQDTWRLSPKLTLTAGLRTTWNSNPVNQQNLNARLRGSFYDISHNPDRPVNKDIQTGLSTVFPSTPLLVWQPRVAVTYSLTPKTVMRAGAGSFSDVLPASVTDSMAGNPPYDNSFVEGLFGLRNGIAAAPGVPDSAIDAAVADNKAFLAGFNGGALSCTSSQARGNCIPQIGITAVPNFVNYPYSLQWSAGVEHQFTENFSLDVEYVGTRGREIHYSTGPNGAQTVCDGCYKPWPYYPDAPAHSPDPRFSWVSQFMVGANSDYNGLQTSVRKRMSHGLDFEANYTWSHCLDTISNGGFFSLNAIPGQLYRNYGPCDYDFRHSLNGFYVYELPFRSTNHFFGKIVSGWQISGSVFLHTGLPAFMTTALQPGALVNTSGPNYPNLVRGQRLYAKKPIAGVTQPGSVQWLNPFAVVAVVNPDTQMCVPANTGVQPNTPGPVPGEGINPQLCQFGNLQRGFFRAPGFRWADIAVSKKFRLTEQVSLAVDVQFYNVFNHPNFGGPNGCAGIPGHLNTLAGCGAIYYSASPPTGLLGAGLGGNTAVRMVALRGRIEF